jgi:hypothetical protein
MMCEGMEVIANSLQEFGSWGRRVRQSAIAYKLHFLNCTFIAGDYSKNFNQ